MYATALASLVAVAALSRRVAAAGCNIAVRSLPQRAYSLHNADCAQSLDDVANAVKNCTAITISSFTVCWGTRHRGAEGSRTHAGHSWPDLQHEVRHLVFMMHSQFHPYACGAQEFEVGHDSNRDRQRDFRHWRLLGECQRGRVAISVQGR